MTKQLSMIGILFLAAVMFVITLVIGSTPASATSLVSIDDVSSGNLIRGESFNAVYYYGEDGFRYVFPNDKVFFSWYDNFDDVKWIADSDMWTIQIGGNVTYKPGVKMVKINTDPKTYAVGAGGTLRWVPTEAIAVALYGSNWNTKIDDVADGFFSNYTRGVDILTETSFSVTAEQNEAYSIDADKDLSGATVISISESGFSPSSVTIDAGTAVRWENDGTGKHGASDDDGNWGTGTMNNGQHFSRYFDDTGIYTYYDKYDQSKSATIIVE